MRFSLPHVLGTPYDLALIPVGARFFLAYFMWEKIFVRICRRATT